VQLAGGSAEVVVLFHWNDALESVANAVAKIIPLPRIEDARRTPHVVALEASREAKNRVQIRVIRDHAGGRVAGCGEDFGQGSAELPMGCPKGWLCI
jgi:hypothetical protein